MSAKLRRLEISKCADDTLAELKISNLPVNPVEIARRKEIIVKSWEPKKPGISGFLMKQGDFQKPLA